MNEAETPRSKPGDPSKGGGPPSGSAWLPAGQKDARRYPRFPTSGVDVRLRQKGPTALFGLLGKSISGSASDLSEGGIRVSTGVEISVGSSVELSIDASTFKERFTTGGQVRWCRRDPADAFRYLVGIMFVDSDPSLPKTIERLRTCFAPGGRSGDRERKDPSGTQLPRQAAPAPGASSPPPAGASELEPGVWIIAPSAPLAGASLEALEKAVDDILSRGIHGLLVDFGTFPPGSARDIGGFLKIIDRAAVRGVRSVFVVGAPPLREQIAARSAERREFAEDVPSGLRLLAGGAPSGSKENDGPSSRPPS
jgi:hypothetical protein